VGIAHQKYIFVRERKGGHCPPYLINKFEKLHFLETLFAQKTRSKENLFSPYNPCSFSKKKKLTTRSKYSVQ